MISDEEFRDFIAGLERLTELYSRRDSLRELTGHLKKCPVDVAVDITTAVLPLFFAYISEGQKAAEVVAAIVSALSDYKDKGVLATKKGLALFRSRLTEVLSNRSIAMRAKAVGLVLERGLILEESRVITDMRPVYSYSSPASIDAFSIIHTLVLSCVENGEDRKLHIALDRRDIELLRQALDRSLEKEKVLSKLIEATGTSKIEVK